MSGGQLEVSGYNKSSFEGQHCSHQLMHVPLPSVPSKCSQKPGQIKCQLLLKKRDFLKELFEAIVVEEKLQANRSEPLVNSFGLEGEAS